MCSEKRTSDVIDKTVLRVAKICGNYGVFGVFVVFGVFLGFRVFGCSGSSSLLSLDFCVRLGLWVSESLVL